MKKNRIPAILLTLILFFNLFSTTASAEGFQFEFDSENGEPHCKSYYMVNIDTGTTVYANGADTRLPMASLTKIMTYIIAYEYIPHIETAEITVMQSVVDELTDTGSSLANIQVGETFTGRQLLYLMMVPSGNDAALTFAKYIDSLGITEDQAVDGGDPGKVLTCVDLMNLKAAELGAENTHYMNPHGLYDPDHYSSARDIALITEYAMTLPNFTEITSTTAYIQAPTNLSEDTSEHVTTNQLLLPYSEYYYANATGIKTGSLNESGYCICASASSDGYTYLLVCLGSPYVDNDGNMISEHGEMIDAKSLFSWAFSTLERKTIVTKNDLLGDVKLEYAFRKEALQVVAADNVTTLLPRNVQVSSIILTYNLPESVQAPVKKGDVVGSVTLTYAEDVIATVDLVASESVERSDLQMFLTQGQKLITSTWFLILLAIVAGFFIVYLILRVVYKQKKKKLKNVKRHRNL